jgi:hypothetical protein
VRLLDVSERRRDGSDDVARRSRAVRRADLGASFGSGQDLDAVGPVADPFHPGARRARAAIRNVEVEGVVPIEKAALVRGQVQVVVADHDALQTHQGSGPEARGASLPKPGSPTAPS